MFLRKLLFISLAVSPSNRVSDNQVGCDDLFPPSQFRDRLRMPDRYL